MRAVPAEVPVAQAGSAASVWAEARAVVAADVAVEVLAAVALVDADQRQTLAVNIRSLSARRLSTCSTTSTTERLQAVWCQPWFQVQAQTLCSGPEAGSINQQVWREECLHLPQGRPRGAFTSWLHSRSSTVRTDKKPGQKCSGLFFITKARLLPLRMLECAPHHCVEREAARP
jgi:hypothetical protein